MISMLKMDIRRMFRSKSFYLALIIFLLFSGYTIWSQAKWQVINGYSIPQHFQLDAGLYSIVNYYLNTTIQYMYTFTLKNGLIIFGIYMITFIASDYQSGFIKNSCMMCKNKNSIVWNKLCITFIISAIVVCLSLLETSILGYLFVDDFMIGNINDIVIFSSINILLYVAFFSGITFLYRLIRNKIPSILITLLLPLGIIAGMLQPILGKYIDYTIGGILFALPINFEITSSLRVIAILIMYIILYQGLSIFLIRKRDI